MLAHNIAQYEIFMLRCIELAMIAKNRGDAPVGAIIAIGSEIITEGIEGGKTHCDITFHAEIEAIRKAIIALNRNDLSDCTLITTHEPCIMCSYVIRHYKIKTVAFGIKVDEIGGTNPRCHVLTDETINIWSPPPEIIWGILEDKCAVLKM